MKEKVTFNIGQETIYQKGTPIKDIPKEILEIAYKEYPNTQLTAALLEQIAKSQNR